ncbi:MAG TPA: chemotaxis-specific protein-glutamate methyltransferase CheB [Polyangiaceae bacterium]|nr:chemotaxis-specific protein-glutamate methyltransferase CheB [Polyangiaceae bacterium]
MKGRFRVLVADDSPTARELLVAIVSGDSRFHVVGAARNGNEAVAMAKSLSPDIALLDIHMPGMDGVEATRHIMAEAPTPVIVVSASVDVRDLAVAFEAERAGAVAARPKPMGPHSPSFARDSAELLSTLHLMVGMKVVRRHRPPSPRSAPIEAQAASVVALVCSTGGPPALAAIVASLPADFPLPLLCVQHMSKGWMAGLVKWLDEISKIRVKLAEDAEPLRPGTLYFAPEDRHLALAGRHFLRLLDGPPVAGFRPSGTTLFESVAHAFGREALGIILTGMGEDGVAGLRVLRESGGACIAQDRESSVVWGMPGAAVAAGLANDVRSLDGMVRLLNEVGRARRSGGG